MSISNIMNNIYFWISNEHVELHNLLPYAKCETKMSIHIAYRESKTTDRVELQVDRRCILYIYISQIHCLYHTIPPYAIPNAK